MGDSHCGELEVKGLVRHKAMIPRILLFGSQYFWLFFLLNFAEISFSMLT